MTLQSDQKSRETNVRSLSSSNDDTGDEASKKESKERNLNQRHRPQGNKEHVLTTQGKAMMPV